MRCEGGKHTTRNAAIAVGFTRSENRVRFVHHHDHRTESANGHENARLLAFGVADPFGSELTHFHDGKAAFAGEAIDEKRFADTDAAGNEDAAFEDVGLAVLN